MGLEESSLNNKNVFSGGVYRTEKDLRGKLEGLKTFKIKGKVLQKEEWKRMMTGLVKARSGKITVNQLEKDLYSKLRIPQRERNRIMTWAKKNFVKSPGVVTQKGNGGVAKVNVKDTIFNGGGNRRGYVVGEDQGVNNLGMKDKGSQRGHGGGMSGTSGGSIRNAANNESRGMVQPGSSNITREVPRDLGGNSFNSSIRPRQGGL